jgi:hypothetical protein
MIDCPEAVRRMWAYLGAALEPNQTAELEVHLGVCKRCCGELEFSRELRGLVAATNSPVMPDDLRGRVEHLLGAGRAGETDR